MKIEVSDYYKLKGYSKAYLYKRKDDRMAITLTGIGMKQKGMLYSKYLYCSFYQCDVIENEHIDHINGDKKMIELKIFKRYLELIILKRTNI